MHKATWILILIYIVCTIVDSFASEHEGKRYGKVFLIPLLCLILWLNHWQEILLYLSLSACWLGDLFLIHKSPKRNMIGMLCFLTGHLCYLFLFAGRIRRFSIIWFLFGIVLYGCLILFYFRKIWKNAPGNLKIPSMVYMMTIFAMSIACFLSIPASSLWITWAGTMLFLISDFLISDQLFRHLPQKGVMETYGTAQLLIVIGLLV